MFLNIDLVPQLHSVRVTWDELLILIVGLLLLMLVGSLGRNSRAGQHRRQTGNIERIANIHPNGSQPHRRALAIESVSHQYESQWALINVSLAVPAGASIGILGPNGAGKTTLLHILATLVQPTAGDVVVGNRSLRTDPVAVRRQVGLVAHTAFLYPHLTVWENLAFFGRLYGILMWPERANELLAHVRLHSKQDVLVRSLSHGQRQRVAIARALMHDPDLVLLDEPYTGLDMRAAERLDMLLDDLKRLGHTLLFTSHDPVHSLIHSDRLIILAGGRIVYEAESRAISLTVLQSRYRQVLDQWAEDDDD